ncbi:FAD/NAD(P)-binding domain-containing protein [Neolentinus lepideus HHB14362 ss-1]|uniref:FAD/NAD(P)-binding domain-containing protein n=1 Tax=Neolentinus lepideus HHB14362 ss-1 TaxID=1314782 RepID=A0A165PRI2_9AGAM|nr:FAD/NAD(P)-binding domain-containing protein [Neolentinus lepideus HHB14362 ss-1]
MCKQLPYTRHSKSNICIIGAGAAGLYTAMILDSLDLPYEILEASERVGGRLFTYHFPQGSKYDYYDVGAMRFPDTPYMRRTFDLVRDRLSLSSKLIPYKFHADNNLMYFNHRRYQPYPPPSSPPADPFGARGYVPDKYLSPENPAAIVDKVLEPWRKPFEVNIETALQNLYTQDKYTMRSHMSLKCDPPYPSSVINWCETMDESTKAYDRAFVETVLDSVAFQFPGKKEYLWYCFDGGSSILPEAMKQHINLEQQIDPKQSTRIKYRKRVQTIIGDPSVSDIYLSVEGENKPRKYTAVFCTAPLPAVRSMDLEHCGLDYATWNAIRGLQYGSATKIGILFSEPWWRNKDKLETGPIEGGQSTTDLMLRTIVYPSYPELGTPSNVIIASYCWTQDAERMGGLIQGQSNSPTGPDLIELVLRELAKVHGIDFSYLKSLYKDYHAFSWTHDPSTLGAFAFFGPHDFEFMNSVFNNLTKPICGGKLFFAGEATSSCHAWVAGALESSWRAVDMYLQLHHTKEMRHKFHSLWGSSEYWPESYLQDQIRIGLSQSMKEPWTAIPGYPTHPIV